MPHGGTPDPKEWAPWTPEEAVAQLRGLNAPWHIAGGWALDLWQGKQTRPRYDLEIAVKSAAFSKVREALAGFDLFAAQDGRLEAIADQATAARQYWVLDPAIRKWRLDILLEPGDDQMWVYRRDPRVKAPLADVTATTPAGIPYLRPEAVLLFKAKDTRPKDERDFDLCASLLDADARAWLRHALETAHPGHAWLSRLQGS